MKRIENLNNELISKKIITENESKSIDLNKIYSFLNSDFVKRIKKSKEIKKEKAFCMEMDAKEFYDNVEDETILIQGIIDLYYIDENDNIVLVDYKTDYVKNENELIDKYKVQLKIYKKALEKGLNKKVAQIYIYSLYLNKEISIKL